MRILTFPHRLVVYSLALFFAAIFVAPAGAQDVADYALQSDSKLWIDGTSTQSDFTVNAAEVKGNFGIAGTGADAAVSSGKITVEASKLEGGRSTIMDRLMHDALKVKEHPTISYELTKAERGAAGTNGSTTLNTTGKLTLAGTTKTIQMPVKAVRQADGKIRFTGSYPLKMSDYGITPPTAMFGALRTADDVTVHFDVVAAPAE